MRESKRPPTGPKSDTSDTLHNHFLSLCGFWTSCDHFFHLIASKFLLHLCTVFPQFLFGSFVSFVCVSVWDPNIQRCRLILVKEVQRYKPVGLSEEAFQPCGGPVKIRLPLLLEKTNKLL